MFVASEEEIAEKEWTVALGRHRKGRRKTQINARREHLGPLPFQPQPPLVVDFSSGAGQNEFENPEEEHRIMQNMIATVKKVEESSFYAKFLDQLQSPEVLNNVQRAAQGDSQLQMVVYGIGSIASSENSRLQLSLALLLKRKFCWVGEIEVFDPILSSSERRVIQSLGCISLEIDEQGRRSAKRPTLFFMPHCEAFLYDNVLRANWSSELLNRIVLLGNSFSCYLENVSQHRRSPAASSRYVLAIVGHAQEFEIQTGSGDFFAAFNQMSWHFFCLDSLSDASLFQM